MITTSLRGRDFATKILLATPLASLLINGLSWLHYGIDLPFHDDMRAYMSRTATSLDPRLLFIPANDTLYPVGMAFDALAQRYLNGNSIAYQFISMMGLLGGLLYLQWRLLLSALQDHLHAAAAFSLCLFMLWPESYWGLQNLAYHHGLPVLFLLGALTVLVTTSWATWWGVPAVFLLGLLAGFSYISGAFATLAAGLMLFALSIYIRAKIPSLRGGGAALIAAGLIAVTAQLGVMQQGRLSNPLDPLAWPTEGSFWMFLLGKIGRGLALPVAHSGLSLVVVLSMLALVAALGVRLVGRIVRERSNAPYDLARTAVVFLTLTAILTVYLPMVAAARTYLEAPESRTLMAMFIHGMPEHYHAFWVTLLLPWIAAAALVFWRTTFLTLIGTRGYVAPVAAGILIIGATTAGGFSHGAFYKKNAEWRMQVDVACVRKAVETGIVACPEWYPPQLLSVITYARQLNASFVRNFPLKPIALGTNVPPPLYRLSEALSKPSVAGVLPAPTADGLMFPGQPDPMMMINVPEGSLAACWELEVTIDIKPDRGEVAELFTLTPEQENFRAPGASFSYIPGGAFTPVTLRAYSLRGFKDRLRIDPVGGESSYIIRELEVRCRARVPGPNE